VYVDLEAEPPINKDNPPDLKVYADAAPVLAKDDPAAATPPAGTKAPPAGKPAKGGKAAAAKDGAAKPAAGAGQPRADDVLALTDRLLEQARGGRGGWGRVWLGLARVSPAWAPGYASERPRLMRGRLARARRCWQRRAAARRGWTRRLGASWVLTW
jgi:hypothetical protein